MATLNFAPGEPWRSGPDWSEAKDFEFQSTKTAETKRKTLDVFFYPIPAWRRQIYIRLIPALAGSTLEILKVFI